MRTTLGGAVLLLAVAATTTACGGSGTDATPSPSKASSTAPTSSAPADPRDQAKADAQEALKRYFEVGNQVGQNPKVPLAKLKTVETSTLLFAEQHQYEKWRSSGWKQVGDLKVTKMQVQSVSLDNSDPTKGKVPSVTVMVCTDSSNVDVVDKSGKSVVLSTRPRALTTLYTVANYHWKADPSNGWRVATGTDKEVGKCTL